MPITTLSDVLNPALKGGYAIAGLVCLGWEEMRAYVAAAEAEQMPAILLAGPACRAHTPLPVLGKMMRHLAENASVPVTIELDHSYDHDECRIAIDCGFSAIMYDGSKKPLQQNIDETAKAAEMAHKAGVSCEGEIGFVGYEDGAASAGTDPVEATLFARQTGIDAMAISVGNVHLQQSGKNAGLDESKIQAIEKLTDLPLVIHGGSGVPAAQRTKLAQQTAVCKFNIGTELRMVFGQALRQQLDDNPALFDRVKILGGTEQTIVEATRIVLRALKPTKNNPSPEQF